MQIYQVLYLLGTNGFQVNLILLPKMTSIKFASVDFKAFITLYIWSVYYH